MRARISKVRAPSLLVTFSVLSLALFLVIGALLAWDLTQYFEQQALDQQKLAVSSLVPPVVGTKITYAILEKGACSGSTSPGDCAQNNPTYLGIQSALANIAGSGLVRVKIWNKQGMVVYSDDPKLIGQSFPVTDSLSRAFSGEPVADISDLNKAENVEERGYGKLLEVYTPLQMASESNIASVFEGYYDITDLQDRINVTNGFLWTSIGLGFLFLYISLFTIVRNASLRLIGQSRENALLLADTRRKAARLEVVNELARSINQSSLDLGQVFQTALRGIDRIVQHTGASITLFGDKVGEERVGLAQASETNGSSAHRIDPADAMRLLGDADTFLSNDTRLAGSPALLALATQGVLSLLLVAIKLGEQRLGILQITGRLPNAFDADDASILKGVADQLAVAIENTRLIKETAETTALRETNRLKDEFVSMVSHELRTPLASIKGYSRTLLSRDGNWDDQTRQEFISIIAEESDKLTDLVENLLEMSRIEAGRLPIAPEPVLLRRFCREVVDRVSKYYPGIRFECLIGDGLPVAVADPRRVEQVLLNLLQNAAKYSRAQVVRVTGWYDGGKEVVLSVEDNGIGIAPENIPHLFDKFYRIENGYSDVVGGTGLGLAISRALVEAQGGRIWVESAPDKGTIFYFTLPALSIDEEAQRETKSAERAM